jgi:hypothetical protein
MWIRTTTTALLSLVIAGAIAAGCSKDDDEGGDKGAAGEGQGGGSGITLGDGSCEDQCAAAEAKGCERAAGSDCMTDCEALVTALTAKGAECEKAVGDFIGCIAGKPADDLACGKPLLGLTPPFDITKVKGCSVGPVLPCVPAGGEGGAGGAGATGGAGGEAPGAAGSPAGGASGAAAGGSAGDQ